jgi:predicted nucleic acid-binding protein
MTDLLLDTSVLIKWFHAEGEEELAEARLLRAAHLRGDVEAHILDLALYEVGNVLLRALRWDPADAADQLDDLLTIMGTPIVSALEWLRLAAELSSAHGLTFSDAAWAAAAQSMGIPLVSADRQLRSAGLAESPTSAVRRFDLL